MGPALAVPKLINCGLCVARARPRLINRAGATLLVRWVRLSVRRQVIDHLGQILAEALEQIIARHAGLAEDTSALILSALSALAKSFGATALLGPLPIHELAASLWPLC